jgi:ABC-2 type transport system permease protein
MNQPYSQFKAMLAITRASLKATFRSPQAVFFSLFFPVVLIVIFGALSGGSGISFDVGFVAKTDTNNAVYKAITNYKAFHVVKGTHEELEDRL